MLLQSVLVFLAVGPILVTLIQRFRRGSSSPLPPGPPKLPVIGNALNFPTDGPAGFRDLSTRYGLCSCSPRCSPFRLTPLSGDVMHLDVLGQPVIVLGSHEAASDLLEKRSSNYSDRAPSPMVDM